MSTISAHYGYWAAALLLTFGMLTPSTASSPQTPSCSEADWSSAYSGNAFISSQEIALKEPPTDVIYGYRKGGNDLVKFPRCELNFRGKQIKIPVFLIDWHDFDPTTDHATPGSNKGVYGEDYTKFTPQQIEQYLNGPRSPASYFREVSGGRLNIQLDVIGWITSGEDSYLKSRESYISFLPDQDSYHCDNQKLLEDTYKEAMVSYNFDPTDYDLNHNQRGHHEGLLNGTIIMYEGLGSSRCFGTDFTGAGSDQRPPISNSDNDLPTFNTLNLSSLQGKTQQDTQLFLGYPIYTRSRISAPEAAVIVDHLNLWVHELGHMLFGFSDYYDHKFNMDQNALSARGSAALQPFHPSGFEKSLLAGWIEPETILADGMYQLTSHDIEDGTDYLSNQTYLYRYNIDGDPNHYLLIENRWLVDAGNTLTQWADGKALIFDMPSGIQIVEVNLYEDSASDIPTFYRHDQTENGFDRGLHDLNNRSWTENEVFEACIKQACMRLTVRSPASQQMLFKFELLQGNYLLDSDGDGLPDAQDEDDDNDGRIDSLDAFPTDPEEWVDTDGDKLGNNADTDDDNDSVPDEEDAFPLDATESQDWDNDQIGDNKDLDDDNDGVEDLADAFPLNANEQFDSDFDGIGNNEDTDDDNDGVADGSDAFPLDRSETLDTDQDGVGNNADSDDDGDGVSDDFDDFPLDSSESRDTDKDGIGNNADNDDDGDGVLDANDPFPLDAARPNLVKEVPNSDAESGGAMGLLAALMLSLVVTVRHRLNYLSRINFISIKNRR